MSGSSIVWVFALRDFKTQSVNLQHFVHGFDAKAGLRLSGVLIEECELRFGNEQLNGKFKFFCKVPSTHMDDGAVLALLFMDEFFG